MRVRVRVGVRPAVWQRSTQGVVASAAEGAALAVMHRPAKVSVPHLPPVQRRARRLGQQLHSQLFTVAAARNDRDDGGARYSITW